MELPPLLNIQQTDCQTSTLTSATTPMEARPSSAHLRLCHLPRQKPEFIRVQMESLADTSGYVLMKRKRKFWNCAKSRFKEVNFISISLQLLLSEPENLTFLRS